MAFTRRLWELMKKYGKVALGVHLSVSAASITGFYVAIKNNVDVESIFEKVVLASGVPEKDPSASSSGGGMVILDGKDTPLLREEPQQKDAKRNRTVGRRPAEP